MSKTYTLKVIKIKQETADTVTLCFKQPGLKKIRYKAGQYLTLIFRINNRRYMRPYSFSSTPGIDEYIEITIKRVFNGIVSNHINDLVKEGDIIEVLEPLGDFVYSPSESVNDIYLWGIGSGITPLFSLAKHILAIENKKSVHLIYGNRNHESTIFLDQINQLKSDNRDRFHVTYFHTRIAENNLHQLIPVEGRIDRDNVLKIVRDNDNIENSIHFICGPSGLKESVKDALSEVNINTNNIFVEDFELIKDPKDFDEIFTQTVKLNFHQIEYDLEVTKGKTILEAALDAEIELPYSCQTGNCDTCKGVLLKGDLKVIGVNNKRDSLNLDEYLLCCSHPLSENVYIEVK